MPPGGRLPLSTALHMYTSVVHFQLGERREVKTYLAMFD